MAKQKVDNESAIPESSDKPITSRQEAFCQYYSYLLNGTEAAKRAGYSHNAAAEIASENLRKSNIQARIAELRIYAGKKYNVTRERLIQEYSKLAFFDIRKIFDDKGNLKPVIELSDEEAAAIGGVEVIKDFLGMEEIHKVKILDRRGALDSLKKMLGFDEVTKMELAGPDGAPLHPETDLSKYTDAELITLAELQRKGRTSAAPTD